ncbi:hypothetical protein RRG08_026287 [Elysia crispata]|uniref:Uncharacterized protein n=1 Tax=Elysia crispata TaxID=231223 RepID=A0AAE0ZAH7_9GAST|nr:hypothetical protein RRG08_026287 [Elysia crispata]
METREGNQLRDVFSRSRRVTYNVTKAQRRKWKYNFTQHSAATTNDIRELSSPVISLWANSKPGEIGSSQSKLDAELSCIQMPVTVEKTAHLVICPDHHSEQTRDARRSRQLFFSGAARKHSGHIFSDLTTSAIVLSLDLYHHHRDWIQLRAIMSRLLASQLDGRSEFPDAMASAQDLTADLIL